MAKNRPDRYETYQKEYNQRTGYAANKKYNESHNFKSIRLQLEEEVYPDVLKMLESVPNKTAYIVSLIRKDIEKTAKDKTETISGKDVLEIE